MHYLLSAQGSQCSSWPDALVARTNMPRACTQKWALDTDFMSYLHSITYPSQYKWWKGAQCTTTGGQPIANVSFTLARKREKFPFFLFLSLSHFLNSLKRSPCPRLNKHYIAFLRLHICPQRIDGYPKIRLWAISKTFDSNLALHALKRTSRFQNDLCIGNIAANITPRIIRQQYNYSH